MSALDAFDPILHQPARLRIMAALYRSRQLGFPTLRDELGLTPGNLGSHLAKLEAAGYLGSSRILTEHGFEMRYRITPAGSEAFRVYLDALRRVLEEAEGPGGPA